MSNAQQDRQSKDPSRTIFACLAAIIILSISCHEDATPNDSAHHSAKSEHPTDSVRKATGKLEWELAAMRSANIALDSIPSDSITRDVANGLAIRAWQAFDKGETAIGHELIDRAIKIAYRLPKPDTAFIMTWRARTAWTHHDEGRIDSALAHLTVAEHLFEHYTPEEADRTMAFLTSLTDISYVNLLLGRTDRALAMGYSALRFARDMSDTLAAIVALENLSEVQLETGHFERAIATCDQALELIGAYHGPSNLGMDYYAYGQWGTKAEALTKLHRLEQADSAFDKHVHFAGRKYGVPSYWHGVSLVEKGTSLIDGRLEIDAAIDAFEAGLNSMPDEDPRKQIDLDVTIRPNLARLFALRGEEEEAMALLGEDSTNVVIDWTAEPSAMERTTKVEHAAGALKALYEVTDDPAYAISARRQYASLLDGLDHLFDQAELEGIAKHVLRTKEKRAEFVDLLFTMDERGHGQLDIDLVADLIEGSRSMMLKKHHHDAYNQGEAGVARYFALKQLLRERRDDPELSFEQAERLQFRIDSLKQLLFGSKELRSNADQSGTLKKLGSIAKQGVTVLSITTYDRVDSIVFVLAAYPDTTILQRIVLDGAMRDALYQLPDMLASGNDPSLLRNATELLSKAIFTSLPLPTTSATIVIPDGAWSRVPFEVLPVPGEKDGELLADMTTIHYEYSIDLIDRERKSAIPGTLFALAPEFAPPTLAADTGLVALNDLLASRPNLRATLGPLVHNREEVDALATRFKGSTITGMHLAKEQVLEGMRNAAVLHFATHAFADQDDPERSAIVISGDASQRSDAATSSDRGWSSHTNDALLHAWEIQTMPLNAQLAVLSACETAVGREQAGEGVMSLARAFRYAGVDNIVSSLWKVDDAATKEIMLSFYDNLAEGMGKADALAEAKRAYRRAHPTAPPAHWAAFVLVGDNEPVVLERRMDLKWLWAIGAVLALAGLAWYRSQRKVAA